MSSRALVAGQLTGCRRPLLLVCLLTGRSSSALTADQMSGLSLGAMGLNSTCLGPPREMHRERGEGAAQRAWLSGNSSDTCTLTQALLSSSGSSRQSAILLCALSSPGNRGAVVACRCHRALQGASKVILGCIRICEEQAECLSQCTRHLWCAQDP